MTPIATEVSIKPRSLNPSTSGRGVLIDVSVDIDAEPLVVDAWGPLEEGE
jgi:hypothetical protein